MQQQIPAPWHELENVISSFPGIPAITYDGPPMLPGIITEVMDMDELPLVAEYADILQVGSRNSQNFSLLKKISRYDKPVLLKRGFGNTVDELISSSKYLSMSVLYLLLKPDGDFLLYSAMIPGPF